MQARPSACYLLRRLALRCTALVLCRDIRDQLRGLILGDAQLQRFPAARPLHHRLRGGLPQSLGLSALLGCVVRLLRPREQ
eukprot:3485251-Pleurochrysis_carterae.AAC.1